MTIYILDAIEEEYREAVFTTSDERTPAMEHIIRLRNEMIFEDFESEEKTCAD